MTVEEPAHSTHAGLSDAEADQRLHDEGGNELPQAPRRTLARIAREVAGEPMFQLLAAAALIYLLLGDVHEALVLLAFVAIIVTIALVQERRTARALEALRDLSSPRALVVRGGVRQRIAGREVVRGDVIVLAEGDRVPADAELLAANDLRIDESLLTGESVPVDKAAAIAEAATASGPDVGRPSRVFAGTLVVGGQGMARVVATGARSEIGRIGRALGTIESGPTPLHQQTRRLVRLFSVLGLGVSAVAALLHGLLRGDWLGGVLAGLTLAMSLLPQEFLLILSVFTAMGAWRMARQRVLTRRPAAIETLGAATVLCTDKTGTLTLNRMAIAELQLPSAMGAPGPSWRPAEGPLPQPFHALLEAGVLASETDPFDPMERALHALGREQLPPARLHPGWTLAHEYPLSPGLPAMTHVWQGGDAGPVVAIKGAPESVGALCRLPPDQRDAMRAAAEALAGRGHRVLGVATGTWAGGAWPPSPAGFDLRFLGLLALADPLRDGVDAAVRECRQAGIRVAMITGDHPGTARAIARQAGIDEAGPILTGRELAGLDDATLKQRVLDTSVFARVTPEFKLRIVQALRAQGEVVAMTGDGVNDAPSLKAAHIGIAMGGRGTDVAREAAAIVLLDDDFGSIVRAVRLGRRIHDNVRKAMGFVLAVHVPIAGLALLPLALGLPLVFTPLHIAFLELVIDPVCSIAFEAEREEADLMQRPPRAVGEPLLPAGFAAWSLLQGLIVLAAVGGGFLALLASGVPEAQARAAAFVALVSCNFALILSNRSFTASLWQTLRRPNSPMWLMLGVTAALLAALLAIPPLPELFRFAAPAAPVLWAAAGLGVVMLAVLESIKPLAARSMRHG
ncbi:cation-translocating P-type ATPase [Ramlibacter aurantiacus]|uniref:cation-translocating P-type ATPase n=1 Tax=Ramlibacter aurantiacus TaxID=2801330 RepID=UPI00338E38B0